MAAVVVRRCWIARVGRPARRGCLRSSCRSGSATAAARPVGVLAWLPARPASPTRPYDFAHAIVDDHSRLAHVELHDDEKAETVTAFVERALAFFAEHRIVAKRLMTDNGF